MQNNNLEFRGGYTSPGGWLYAGFDRKDSGTWEGQCHEVTEQIMLPHGQKLAHAGNDMLFSLPDGCALCLSAGNETEAPDAQS